MSSKYKFLGRFALDIWGIRYGFSRFENTGLLKKWCCINCLRKMRRLVIKSCNIAVAPVWGRGLKFSKAAEGAGVRMSLPCGGVD